MGRPGGWSKSEDLPFFYNSLSFRGLKLELGAYLSKILDA